MVLICSALMISGDEHIFMYLLAISMSSWENVYSVPLPLFKLGGSPPPPLLSCMSSSYIVDINPFSGRWFGDFSYILCTAFHFVDDLLGWQLCCILISGFCTCLHYRTFIGAYNVGLYCLTFNLHRVNRIYLDQWFQMMARTLSQCLSQRCGKGRALCYSCLPCFSQNSLLLFLCFIYWHFI